MRVIGTAGHVDHGKSTLIAALTGVHPDRLKEEQAREMTIDLGFGWTTLPNGEEVGIIDVPGHRDFIENMLSGIGGIDAVLFVVAADEGIMPQTKEHLAILDLLQIPAGIIVLTKTDLASDSGWLDLVESDIRAAVSDTVLRQSPIVRVSAKNKTGLEELVSALQSVLEEKISRPDLNRPRLPIDRVFTMSGFGTVVTGTLQDGYLEVGDEVVILPSNFIGRIRGLQTHKRKEDKAIAGSRTAVNLSGVNANQVLRGDVLVHPNQYTTTKRLDARLRLLKDVSSSVRHGYEVKFFTGSSETIARLRIIGAEELRPGEEGWIQLELRDPVIAVRGDRYILRRPSPGETLGGGVVIDHQPNGRHKRFNEDVIKSLEAIARGSPTTLLFESAMTVGVAPAREIILHSRLETATAVKALNELITDGRLVLVDNNTVESASDTLVAALPLWSVLQERILQLLDAFHRDYPLRRGIPREELKSKLKLTPRIFSAVVSKLVGDQLIVESSAWVAMAGHEVRFNDEEHAKVRKLMRRFDENPFVTPSPKDCQLEVGAEAFNALMESGELVSVSSDVVFGRKDYDFMISKIREFIIHNEKISLAEVRDLFQTSRKYAQGLLEHLDMLGVTVRDGDHRRLRKG